MMPEKKELESLKKRMVESVDDLKKLAEVVKSLAGGIPDFTRETEYLSLTDDREYAFYSGQCITNDISKPLHVDGYYDIVNEFIIKVLPSYS